MQPCVRSCICIQVKPVPNHALPPTPRYCPYPSLLYCTSSMKLKTVAALSATVVNRTHRAAHKVGKRAVAAGLAISAASALQHAMSTLCGVRRRNPGPRVSQTTPTLALTLTSSLQLILTYTHRNTIRASHGLPSTSTQKR